MAIVCLCVLADVRMDNEGTGRWFSLWRERFSGKVHDIAVFDRERKNSMNRKMKLSLLSAAISSALLSPCFAGVVEYISTQSGWDNVNKDGALPDINFHIKYTPNDDQGNSKAPNAVRDDIRISDIAGKNLILSGVVQGKDLGSAAAYLKDSTVTIGETDERLNEVAIKNAGSRDL